MHGWLLALHPGAVLLLTLLAAITDVRTGRIPNALTALGAALGVGAAVTFQLLQAAYPVTLLNALATSSCLLVAGIAAYTHGGLGGGDAKLLTALGAWLGFPAILSVLLFSITAALLLILIACLVRGRVLLLMRTCLVLLASVVVPSLRRTADPDLLGARFPLAVAVFLGTCTWFVLNVLSLDPTL